MAQRRVFTKGLAQSAVMNPSLIASQILVGGRVTELDSLKREEKDALLARTIIQPLALQAAKVFDIEGTILLETPADASRVSSNNDEGLLVELNEYIKENISNLPYHPIEKRRVFSASKEPRLSIADDVMFLATLKPWDYQIPGTLHEVSILDGNVAKALFGDTVDEVSAIVSQRTMADYLKAIDDGGMDVRNTELTASSKIRDILDAAQVAGDKFHTSFFNARDRRSSFPSVSTETVGYFIELFFQSGAWVDTSEYTMRLKTAINADLPLIQKAAREFVPKKRQTAEKFLAILTDDQSPTTQATQTDIDRGAFSVHFQNDIDSEFIWTSEASLDSGAAYACMDSSHVWEYFGGDSIKQTYDEGKVNSGICDKAYSMSRLYDELFVSCKRLKTVYEANQKGIFFERRPSVSFSDFVPFTRMSDRQYFRLHKQRQTVQTANGQVEVFHLEVIVNLVEEKNDVLVNMKDVEFMFTSEEECDQMISLIEQAFGMCIPRLMSTLETKFVARPIMMYELGLGLTHTFRPNKERYRFVDPNRTRTWIQEAVKFDSAFADTVTDWANNTAETMFLENDNEVVKNVILMWKNFGLATGREKRLYRMMLDEIVELAPSEPMLRLFYMEAVMEKLSSLYSGAKTADARDLEAVAQTTKEG